MMISTKLAACLLVVLMTLNCLSAPALAVDRQTGATAPTGMAEAGTQTRRPYAAIEESRGFCAPGNHPYADDETVIAIVLLEGQPAAALPEGRRASAVTKMGAQRSTVRNAMRRAGVSCNVEMEYHTLLNGMAIRASYGDLERIAALEGVQSVHIANHYAPPETVKMESSNEMTGADWFQSRGFMGSGTVIAVLDTGITFGHEAFQVYDGMLKQAAISKDAAQTAIQELGYGTYCSGKIPFAYDYADRDEDAEDDSSGHGTHVSGIAAGYAETPDGGLRFSGAAPDAQILAMKIFSSSSDGTDSSIYFKALEDAYLLGADVINMSLGSPNGFSYDRELESVVFGNIYETLAENGVAVVVAAGNEDSMAAHASAWAGPGAVTSDYADYGVVGAPSAYGRNLSVASAENARYPVHYLTAGTRDIRYYEADNNYFYQTFRDKDSVEYVVVPGCGTLEDYHGQMVKGRIALIARGTISFREKVDNAAAAGAAGALIYNNEDGVVYMGLDDVGIPAASIRREDGEYLVSLAQTVKPDGSDAGWFQYLVRRTPEEWSADEPINRDAPFKLTNLLLTGDQVILCQADSNLALPAWRDDDTRSGLAIYPKNGRITHPDPAVIWNVGTGECGMLTLTDQNGRRLSLGKGSWKLGFDLELDEWSYYAPSDSEEDLRYCMLGNLFADYGIENRDLRIVCRSGEFTTEYFNGEDTDFRLNVYSRTPIYPEVPTNIGSLAVHGEPTAADSETAWLMSDFSSWGVTPELQLKPEITGVGGNVWSADFLTEHDYVRMSGTSMAAPNVAGVMADTLQYLREKHSEIPAQTRWRTAEALLQSSARILKSRSDASGIPADKLFYSPRKQGAGLVDLENAARARAYIEDPVISLGDDPDGKFEITFTVRSLYDRDVMYSLDTATLADAFFEADWDKDGRPDSFYNRLASVVLEEGYTVTGPEAVTVPAGGTTVVSLTLELDEERKNLFRQVYPNGNFIDGFVRLTETAVRGRAFDDVRSPSKFYYTPVYWAVAHNPAISVGVTANDFKPNQTCTRAQIVTFLWRAAGEPEPKTKDSPFADVKRTAYYYKPVLWAVENNITNGTSAKTFSPNKTASRGQAVTFLWRFAGKPSAMGSEYSFLDVKSSAFCYDAIQWAVEKGITKGVSNTAFSPNGKCTRGHAVTFLYRLLAGKEDRRSIHATFSGFFGDWTRAPILERHDWREIVDLNNELQTTVGDEKTGETYAEQGKTYLNSGDLEVNVDVNKAYAVNGADLAWGTFHGVLAGDNLYVTQPYNEAHIAISPNGITDALLVVPAQLRNARHMVMTVTDAETGELYFGTHSEYVPKNTYSRMFGQWMPTSQFLYNGTDAEGIALPGGTKLEVRVYGNLPYGEDRIGAILGEGADAGSFARLAAEDSRDLLWSFPLTIDDTAPEVSNCVYDPEAKTLTLRADDDQFLAAVGLYPDAQTQNEYGDWQDAGMDEPIQRFAFSDGTAGQGHEIVFENIEPGKYYLSATDYATNETVVNLILSDSAESTLGSILSSKEN